MMKMMNQIKCFYKQILPFVFFTDYYDIQRLTKMKENENMPGHVNEVGGGGLVLDFTRLMLISTEVEVVVEAGAELGHMFVEFFCLSP